jgi:TonB family protein
MSEKIKNNEYLKMVYQYLDKQMTEAEHHAFEKLLYDDPFLSDAVDGLRQMKQADAIKDISIINIVNGKRHKTKTIYFAVSSVLLIVLIVVLAVVFVKKNNDMVVQTNRSETIYPVNTVDNQGGVLFVENNDSLLLEDSILNVVPENIDQSNAKTAKNEIITEKKQVKPVTKKETIRHSLEPLTSIQATADHLQINTNSEKSIVSESNDINNKQISEISTNQLSSLTDEVKTEDEGAGTNPVSKRDGANATSQPLGGFELYNQYIDNNIQYPDIDGSRKRVSLKVQFRVSKSGVPGNISVARGAENEAFVAEAIRLVQNGPKWSPAIKNGEPIEQDVSIRIVFKP